MPIPIGAIIGAAGSLLGGSQQAAATSHQNRESRIWSQHMYGKQKQDAIEFWNMVNAYNSPQEQMKRFQEAGLNPFLIYGQGNPGNAGSIPTPDVQRPEFRTPEFGNAVSQSTNILGNYMDYEIKQAQHDNLQMDNLVKFEDSLLRAAQRENINGQTARTYFDLELDKELREVSSDYRREQLRSLKSQTDIALSRDEREAAMNSSNLREAAERILSMREQRANTRVDRDRIRSQIRNIESDTRIKQLDAELKQLGIQPGDPIYMRFLARLIGPDAILNTGKGALGRLFGN